MRYDTNLIEKGVVKINDTALEYKILGNQNAAPLIMMQGAGLKINCWEPTIINELAKNNKIYLYNYRGFQKSLKGKQGINVNLLTKDVLDFMDHFNIKKANMLGYCAGGMILQNILAYNPNKVKKAILVSTPISGEKPALRFKRFIEATRSVRPIEQEYLSAFSHFECPAKDLEKCENEVLILITQKDFIINLADCLSLHKILKNSKFIKLEKGNHTFLCYNGMTNIKPTVKALNDFLGY